MRNKNRKISKWALTGLIIGAILGYLINLRKK